MDDVTWWCQVMSYLAVASGAWADAVERSMHLATPVEELPAGLRRPADPHLSTRMAALLGSGISSAVLTAPAQA